MKRSPDASPSGEAFRGLLSVLVVHITAVTAALVGLKGGTSRVMAGGGVGRTYGDLLGGAIALAIVIHAVLYVAANALNMVATATASLFGHDGIFLLRFFGNRSHDRPANTIVSAHLFFIPPIIP